MEIYDEDKAVAYILNKIETEKSCSKKYTADDILEIIDIIWDYYEDNGLLDLNISDDDDVEEDIDKNALIKHIQKLINKDKNSSIVPEDIPAIVNAELSYENLCDEL